jgi:Leucine Rich repeat
MPSRRRRTKKGVSVRWCFAPPFASPPAHRYIHDEEFLDLSSSNIDTAQAKQIAKELATNSTLETLNLDTNSIGGDGAQAIAHALTANKTLKQLWLGWRPCHAP